MESEDKPELFGCLHFPSDNCEVSGPLQCSYYTGVPGVLIKKGLTVLIMLFYWSSSRLSSSHAFSYSTWPI